MKKFSITWKITIWYTLFLVMIAVIFFLSISTVEKNRIRESIENALIESVAEASEYIERSGENFVIDGNMDYRDGDAYISVYSGSGQFLEGIKPRELQELPPLRDRKLREVKDLEGNSWYVYDSIFRVGQQYVWVRGITENYRGAGFLSDTVRLMLMLLPLMILIAAVGGFLIARGSLAPLRELIATVKKITADGGLSRRIAVTETNDEISEVAKSFNGMFDSLEKAFNQEKQFTSDVSHELRTPIAVISSQSQYALEDEEYREKALETINRQAKSMNKLVNRLLILSRSDAGRLQLEKEKLNLSHVCQAVAEQQEVIAREKGIEISSNIEDDVLLEGDEAFIIRILLNLIDNAMKYGCPEGGRMQISLKREEDEGTENKAWAVCSVTDYGPGIDPEEQEKIWHRFYRTDQSRSDMTSSGLGLSIVKSLTEAMGGFARLESSKGYGSRFSVYFPILQE